MARTTLHKASDYDWTVPAIFSLTHLQIAAEQGYSTAEVLARAGLPATDGDQFEREMRRGDYERLLDAMTALITDRSVGVEVGWRLPPTAFGSLGQVILASPTLGDALRQCQRFWPLYGMGMWLSVDVLDGTCVIELDTLPGIHETHRHTVLESALTCLYRCGAILLPALQAETEIWLDYPEPAYAPRMRERLGNLRFAAPSCQLRYPARWLQAPLPLSNPLGYRAAVEQCERETRLRGLADQGVVGHVQRQLTLDDAGYPDFDQVARRLHMTPRTLRRRLQQEGTRFSKLLNAARRRDALRLLDQADLEIQRIAVLLGYTEPANFTRAFQQWCGQTPSQYRQSRGR